MRVTGLLSALLFMFLSAAPQEVSVSQKSSNGLVLYHAFAIPDGGTYDSSFASSGCPEDIVFKTKRILSASTTGTYCSGFTFTTVMRAATDLGLLDRPSVDDIRAFQKYWYGADATNADAVERQCAFAVKQLGIGISVTADEALPGDFVQFWRTPSGTANGHSAIFLGWVRDDDGAPVGVRFRSSQTGGVASKQELFRTDGSAAGSIVKTRMYFARLTTH